MSLYIKNVFPDQRVGFGTAEGGGGAGISECILFHYLPITEQPGHTVLPKPTRWAWSDDNLISTS